MDARWGLVAAVSLAAGVAARAGEQESTAGGAHDATEHSIVNKGEVKWGPVPEAFPKGAQAAVLQGDPKSEGPFTVRMKMPKGYAIAPHFHPTEEHVTVLSGKLYLGEGDHLDKKAAKALQPGGFASIPKEHHHYAISDASDTVIQVHAMGPFQITYLNEKDDPRKNVAKGSESQGSRAGRTPTQR